MSTHGDFGCNHSGLRTSAARTLSRVLVAIAAAAFSLSAFAVNRPAPPADFRLNLSPDPSGLLRVRLSWRAGDQSNDRPVVTFSVQHLTGIDTGIGRFTNWQDVFWGGEIDGPNGASGNADYTYTRLISPGERWTFRVCAKNAAGSECSKAERTEDHGLARAAASASANPLQAGAANGNRVSKPPEIESRAAAGNASTASTNPNVVNGSYLQQAPGSTSVERRSELKAEAPAAPRPRASVPTSGTTASATLSQPEIALPAPGSQTTYGRLRVQVRPAAGSSATQAEVEFTWIEPRRQAQTSQAAANVAPVVWNVPMAQLAQGATVPAPSSPTQTGIWLVRVRSAGGTWSEGVSFHYTARAVPDAVQQTVRGAIKQDAAALNPQPLPPNPVATSNAPAKPPAAAVRDWNVAPSTFGK